MRKKYAYYFMMTLAGLIGFSKIALYAHFLTPSGLGTYSFCLLLSTYGIYACSLGLYEGALGVFPIWYGQSLGSKVQITRNQILGFLCFSGIGLCTLSVTTILVSTLFPFRGLTAFLICLLSSSSTFFLILLADTRSRLRTFQFAVFMLARAFLSLLMGSLFARNHGYVGIILSEVLITLLLTTILAAKESENFGFMLPEFTTLRPVARIGFPLMLNGIATNTAANVDRFFVVAALGSEAFGQYSFAMILASVGAMVQSILYQQIGPEILQNIGQGLPSRKVISNLNRVILFILLFSVIAAYPLLLAAEKLVVRYFSEYSQAASTLPIIYVGATFTAISLYENFAVALGKTEYILVLNSFIILFILLASYLAVQYDASIFIFSGIYAVGRCLYFLLTLGLALWAVNQMPRAKG